MINEQRIIGTLDDDDDRDDERPGENEALVRETDEHTEPEEFEIDDEDRLGYPEDDDVDDEDKSIRAKAGSSNLRVTVKWLPGVPANLTVPVACAVTRAVQ